MAAVCVLTLWIVAGPDSSLAQTPVEPSATEESSAAGEAAPSAFDASAPSASEAAPASSFITKATQIRELIAGALDPSIPPESLFDVPLVDAALLALEAARLEQLLELAEETTALPVDVAEATWSARRELDQARLAFYRLPTEERTALLAAHAERAARELPTLQAARAAERAAAQERERALAAAQRARSEAERIVAEERARLLGTASQLAAQQAELTRAKAGLAAHAEHTLTLRRRVRQTISARRIVTSEVDALHEELRRWLRQSRGELATALSRPAPAPPPVRRAELDALANLGVQVDRSEVDQLFAKITATAAQLREQARVWREQRIRQLYEEVQSLNDDRLVLVSHLSRERRAALLGFGPMGWDQAIAELRQLTLVVRYQVRSVSQWITSGAWRQWSGQTAGLATASLLELILVLVVFFWARRSARWLLGDLRERVQTDRRRLRRGPLEGGIELLLRIFNPLTWLLLVVVALWVLPQAITELLPIQLLSAILKWSLGGWLAVVSIDTLAMRRVALLGWRNHSRTDELRLRSLRLIGMAVVGIGLVLSLSQLIVGAGTVYSWVLQTCWWAALPLGFLIVHWWRDAIFERFSRLRGKPAWHAWVLERRNGWRGLLIAAVVGPYLFSKGAWSVLKGWLSRFEVTRRGLAYLFRQQLDRMAERGATPQLAPLPEAILAAISPAAHSATHLPVNQAKEQELIERIEHDVGGVYAVVGERGSGRSTVLERVRADRERVILIDCPFAGLEALVSQLVHALELPCGTLEDVARALSARSGRHITILIDNAHRLIHPVMGGLAAFDQLLDCARRHSARCVWVFSMDRVVWWFYGRARDVHLLFNAVIELAEWSEEHIVALLELRSREAGIEPNFATLIAELPPETDVDERQEALRHAADSYYRLIWDHAAGNPGVALHTWCTSLGIAPDGGCYVIPFRVPSAATFEALPDSAVFVMRAVLQLEHARAADVAQATMVPLAEVEAALHFGVHSGYLECRDERYAITWDWYRPITRFLQRRHLLARL